MTEQTDTGEASEGMTPARRAALQWFDSWGGIHFPFDEDDCPEKVIVDAMVADGQLTGSGIYKLTPKGRAVLASSPPPSHGGRG